MIRDDPRVGRAHLSQRESTTRLTAVVVVERCSLDVAGSATACGVFVVKIAEGYEGRHIDDSGGRKAGRGTWYSHPQNLVNDDENRRPSTTVGRHDRETYARSSASRSRLYRSMKFVEATRCASVIPSSASSARWASNCRAFAKASCSGSFVWDTMLVHSSTISERFSTFSTGVVWPRSISLRSARILSRRRRTKSDSPASSPALITHAEPRGRERDRSSTYLQTLYLQRKLLQVRGIRNSAASIDLMSGLRAGEELGEGLGPRGEEKARRWADGRHSFPSTERVAARNNAREPTTGSLRQRIERRQGGPTLNARHARHAQRGAGSERQGERGEGTRECQSLGACFGSLRIDPRFSRSNGCVVEAIIRWLMSDCSVD